MQVSSMVSPFRGTIILPQVYSINRLREMLYWLDNWPAGLKLNTELSAFLFATLSAMLDVWEGLT